MMKKILVLTLGLLFTYGYTYAQMGCTNPDATNYDPSATIDDGSCNLPVGLPGCTNLAATNFNPMASFDDGSCTFDIIIPVDVPGCTNKRL